MLARVLWCGRVRATAGTRECLVAWLASRRAKPNLTSPTLTNGLQPRRAMSSGNADAAYGIHDAALSDRVAATFKLLGPSAASSMHSDDVRAPPMHPATSNDSGASVAFDTPDSRANAMSAGFGLGFTGDARDRQPFLDAEQRPPQSMRLANYSRKAKSLGLLCERSVVVSLPFQRRVSPCAS